MSSSAQIGCAAAGAAIALLGLVACTDEPNAATTNSKNSSDAVQADTRDSRCGKVVWQGTTYGLGPGQVDGDFRSTELGKRIQNARTVICDAYAKPGPFSHPYFDYRRIKGIDPSSAIALLGPGQHRAFAYIDVSLLQEDSSEFVLVP